MKRPSNYVRERLLLKNKPRKVLNLEERVQAIRMHDREQVYQRVASVFKCSWEQIKNVVSNRNAILQYYADCQTIVESDGPHSKRNKKINFLSSVMHEYIKRASYHRHAILTDESIRAKALEFRDILEIDNFYPNKMWINDFKHVYNINLPRLKGLIIAEEPPKTLGCSEIIEHCRQVIHEAATAKKSPTTKPDEQKKQAPDVVSLSDDANNDEEELDDYNAEHETGDILYFGDEDDDNESNADKEEGPTIDYGSYDYNECDFDELTTSPASISGASMEKQTETELITGGCKTRVSQNSETATTTSAIISTSQPVDSSALVNTKPASTPRNSPLPTATTNTSTETHTHASRASQEIGNYAEALQLLRPLEEFAMLIEDFLAINLLAQLAECYEKAMKRAEK